GAVRGEVSTDVADQRFADVPVVPGVLMTGSRRTGAVRRPPLLVLEETMGGVCEIIGKEQFAGRAGIGDGRGGGTSRWCSHVANRRGRWWPGRDAADGDGDGGSHCEKNDAGGDGERRFRPGHLTPPRANCRGLRDYD